MNINIEVPVTHPISLSFGLNQVVFFTSNMVQCDVLYKNLKSKHIMIPKIGLRHHLVSNFKCVIKKISSCKLVLHRMVFIKKMAQSVTWWYQKRNLSERAEFQTQPAPFPVAVLSVQMKNSISNMYNTLFLSPFLIGRNSNELMQACRKYRQTKSNCHTTLWCTDGIKRMDYYTIKQAPVSAFLSPCQDCTAVPWFLHVQAPNSALSQSHVLVHLLSP